jgi:hypothetical protein
MVIHNEPVHYAVIPATSVDSVDYSQTLCRREGVRFSLDGTKAIVKWTGNTTPSSVSAISEAVGPYTQSDILVIVSGTDWEPQDL